MYSFEASVGRKLCLQSLHPHSWSTGVAADSAIALVSYEKYDSREAYQQVDEILQPAPRAEQEIHDVPVAAQITAERDETPVESADGDEDERDTVQ